MEKKLGDMPSNEFKEVGHKLIDWSADYLDNIESYNVQTGISPGDIKAKLPMEPPEQSEPFDKIISDLNKIILPGVTHWQHPNFMAYFNSSASGPGILADIVSSAFNVNGMVWKSCPAVTELEQTVMDWYRQMLGLPKEFFGVVYDVASTSNMHGIACAREYVNIGVREKGMSSIPRLRIYCTAQAHSSVDKGALTLGFGLEGIKKIPHDKNFAMIPSELERAINEDRANGIIPCCVVATIGTTSSSAVDPIKEIADICERENIWFHVDCAYAGVTAMLPEMKKHFVGIERADSIVSNPHKWMFIPIDFSAFYTRKPEILKRAFSLVPEYLKTNVDSIVENYMDYGVPLGRRFRALKLWFVIRYFGVDGIRERIREHIRIANQFAKWIDEHESFERLADVNFSLVCFRANPKGYPTDKLNELNEKLLNEINSTGKLFIVHTKLNGAFTIRLVISGIRQEERHVVEAWNLIQNSLHKILGN
jgi:aromatic-L-amino-acid/L-tryptophan decarboxylase